MSTLLIRNVQSFPALSPRLLSLFSQLQSWHDRHRQRAQLAQLDDRQLRDIGLNSQQARHESAKYFWQR